MMSVNLSATIAPQSTYLLVSETIQLASLGLSNPFQMGELFYIQPFSSLPHVCPVIAAARFFIAESFGFVSFAHC